MILFSYSALRKLLYNPIAYYNYYILNMKEDSLESFLVEGKLIHCLLLQNDKFDDLFIVNYVDNPSDSVVSLLDTLYKDIEVKGGSLVDYKPKILSLLKDIKLYQSIKTDEDRLAKVITDKANSYWTFKLNSVDKLIIDSSTFNKCNKVVNDIKENPSVMFLLGDELYCEVHTEEELSMEYTEYGIKGVIDRYTIDHANKTINLIDFKTTSKPLREFVKSVDIYDYWLQMAVYRRLILNKYSDYALFCYFIVVDQFNLAYDFMVTESTLLEWDNKLSEVLNTAEWHVKNNDYKLPYLFATKQIVL